MTVQKKLRNTNLKKQKSSSKKGVRKSSLALKSKQKSAMDIEISDNISDFTVRKGGAKVHYHGNHSNKRPCFRNCCKEKKKVIEEIEKKNKKDASKVRESLQMGTRSGSGHIACQR